MLWEIGSRFSLLERVYATCAGTLSNSESMDVSSGVEGPDILFIVLDSELEQSN
jgi:hypothetical protein